MHEFRDFLKRDANSRFVYLCFKENIIHLANPLTKKWLCNSNTKLSENDKQAKIGMYELVDYFIEQFTKAKSKINHDTFWLDIERKSSSKDSMLNQSFKSFSVDYFTEDFLNSEEIHETPMFCEKCLGKFMDNILYNSKSKAAKLIDNFDNLF